MFQNVFTCSKQALPEKNKGSKYSFDSKSFLYANVYKVLWKVLALASVPTPLPKIHFRYPTLTASRLPHLTLAENRRTPQWVYSFSLIHLPSHFLMSILTLHGSSLWSVFCKYPHSFALVSLHHAFLANPPHCLRPTLHFHLRNWINVSFFK